MTEIATVVVRVNVPSVVVQQNGQTIINKSSPPVVGLVRSAEIITISAPGPQGVPGPPGPSGMGSTPYTEKTSDYYLQVGIDGFVGANATNGDMTIFLPVSTVGNEGTIFSVMKMDATSYTVTVQTQMGQPIANINNSLLVYTDQGEEYNFISTSSGWNVF